MSNDTRDGLCRTKEQVAAVAEEQGLICFFPDNYELTLDFDVAFRLVNKYYDKANRIIEVLGNNGIEVDGDPLYTKSKSGHAHVWIRLSRPMDVASRVALQAAMGSDPVREILSILRHQCGSAAASALFETPDAAELVNSWRSTFNRVNEFEGLGV